MKLLLPMGNLSVYSMGSYVHFLAVSSVPRSTYILTNTTLPSTVFLHDFPCIRWPLSLVPKGPFVAIYGENRECLLTEQTKAPAHYSSFRSGGH